MKPQSKPAAKPGLLSEASRAEIDRWIVDAAALCQARDPQLDLRGALPALALVAARKAEPVTA